MSSPHRASGLRTPVIIALVIAVLYLARAILIPLAFAVVLALVLSPVVGWLQKCHLPRLPSVLATMLVMMAVAGGVGYVILNQFVLILNDLPGYRENIDSKIRAFQTTNKGSLGRAAQNVREIGKELAAPPDVPTPTKTTNRTQRALPSSEAPLPVQVIEPPPSSLAYARDLTAPFLEPLAVLGIVLVFTLFLLLEQADLRNRLFRLAGLHRLNLVTKALAEATHRVSHYLMLQFLVNGVFGLLCGIGLYFIGVPYAVLWAAVAALLRIVPYVGPVVAGSLPLLLSLAVFDGWLRPLLVVLLFTVLELVTGNLVEPLLYGAHTGISSLALLLTTVFWAVLWGPAGLILATPLTVCVVVLGRYLPQLSFLHVLLGDEPVLSPDAHLYQRLLAMDEFEARAVVDTYLAEHSLAQFYDAVVLPVLMLAEQDRHKGALDPEREEFLFLSLREMLAEFSEKTQHQEIVPSGNPEAPSWGRVLCFPAHDEADEIAAAMLGQLVEQAGRATIVIPLGFSPQSMFGVMEPAADDILCISAVQPFAFSRARAVNQQLRLKFPQNKIMIGIWGFTGDCERALQRFKPSQPNKFVVGFAEALEYLDVSESPKEADVEIDSAPLGESRIGDERGAARPSRTGILRD